VTVLPPEPADPAPAPTRGVAGQSEPVASRAFLLLCLAAAGVVFGDIGTSPLYTFSQLRIHGVLEDPNDILGSLSLVFWTLTLVASGKYVALMLRADNHGEGGGFALMAQVQSIGGRGSAAIVTLLTLSAALLYGETLLTPAISVLSAMEGLRVVRPGLGGLVVPGSLVVLTVLFALQHRRTERVNRTLGGIMVIWFVVLAGLGTSQILLHPEVLVALAPHHALWFLWKHGFAGSLGALGAVVLCITGSEALFADMGQFGARAIRTGWWVLVYPALVLQYFGQGAFLWSGGEVVGDNVFFSIVPKAWLVPMIILAVLAAMIASQALLSTAFGLTRSAINLGLLPRLAVVYTGRDDQNQIYVAPVNWALWFGSCMLVAQLGSVSRLTSVYGLSVVATMLVTTLATAVIAQRAWRWSPLSVRVVFGGLGLIEGGYLVANAAKLPVGAWFPLVVGGLVFAVTRIWLRGRAQMVEAISAVERWTVAELLESKTRLPELPRAMVFLTPERVLKESDPIPLVLLKFVDRYGSLPRHITLFSIATEMAHPFWKGTRFDVRHFGDNVSAVCMHVGYMESPNTRAALVHLREQREMRVHATRWTIVMGREEVIVSEDRGVRGLLDWLFTLLASAAVPADVWFGLGSDTGISKEVIPLVFDRHGKMVVAIHKPDLTSLPPPKPPEPPEPTTSDTGATDDRDDTSLSDIPRVTGPFTDEVRAMNHPGPPPPDDEST
jgi:KUP system potassium uptake protein